MAEDKKIEPCIRCGSIPEEKDKYCIHCGAPLVNKCTRPKSPLHAGCSKVNRRDAAFCSGCGHPTTFRVEGLL